MENRDHYLTETEYNTLAKALSDAETFRYDLASMTEPRVILITSLLGSRNAVPRLGYVVLPQPK